MNKLLLIVLVAGAFCSFVNGEDFYTSSSSNPFLDDSSDSSSDSSDSSLFGCPKGEYFNGTECLPCSPLLNCLTCVNGSTCSQCPDQFRMNEKGFCVYRCDAFDEGCSVCSQSKCLKCETENCCSTVMQWYWNSTTQKCEDPAVVFGEGCLAANSTSCVNCIAQSCCKPDEVYMGSLSWDGRICISCNEFYAYTDYGNPDLSTKCDKCSLYTCTKCSSNSVLLYGSCAPCSSLFGEGCLTCNANECTSVAEGCSKVGIVSRNCSSNGGQGYGEGCIECHAGGCDACDDGYFMKEGFCKSCQQVFGGCKNGVCTADGCAECEEGYALVDGFCRSCQDVFGEGCDTCGGNGCTAPFKGYFIYNGTAFSCEDIKAAFAGNTELEEECNNRGTREKPSSVRNHPEMPSASAIRSSEYQLDFEYVTDNGVTYTSYVFCRSAIFNCDACKFEEAGSLTYAACTKCTAGTSLINGRCEGCSSGCRECDTLGCTQCYDGFTLINGECVKCSSPQYYDEELKMCMSDFEKGGSDRFCTSYDESGACTACAESTVLGNEGKCVSCEEIYGTGCMACNSTHCTFCFADDCCPTGTQIIYRGSSYTGRAKKDTDIYCGSCEEAYGEKCSRCSIQQCVACEDGYTLNEQGQCISCSEMFEGCSQCTLDMCTKCSNDKAMTLINGCFVDPDILVTSSSIIPGITSSQPLEKKSGDEGEPDNAGMIAGIVIAVVVAAVLVCICIFCVATAGKKHGKIDPQIYEEDAEFVSMSVL